MNRKMLGATGVGLALALFLSINVLASTSLRSARVDLTESKLYTLSDGSKSILKKTGEIDEKIKLRLFFSKKLAQGFPPLPDYGKRVEEMLLEYARRSNGAIEVEVLDPEPFTETEDMAVQAGVRGVPARPGETLYFGLAASNSTGEREVIPFLQPDREAFLEYDLTKLVYQLSNAERTVVGVLSSLPIEGQAMNPMQMRQMPQPWFVMDQLRQLYETKTILPGAKEIPPEVDVLLLVHPKDLGQELEYAIDQFVLKGGKALVFVDPYCELDESGEDPSNPMSRFQARKDSNLERLMTAWGVKMDKENLVGDLDSAISVQFQNKGRMETGPFVVWLGLTEERMNAGEVPIDQLRALQMRYAGALAAVDGATTKLVPLVESSANAQLVPVSRVQFMADPAALMAEFLSTNRKYALAARLEGPSKSAFPEGKPASAPTDEGETPPPSAPTGEHLAESKGPINVIVVADCDMLADNTWVRTMDFGGQRLGTKTADNGDLVTNAVDFLGGSTDLISLRSRGTSARPFKKVDELEREAEQALRAEEQRLTREFDEGERRLNELLSKQDDKGGGLLLTPEAEAEIDKLKQAQIETRKRLRGVRRDLRRDVESLGTKVKWLNIAAVPTLVLVAAFLTTNRAKKSKSA